MLRDFGIPNAGPSDWTVLFELQTLLTKEPLFRTTNLQMAEQSDYRKRSILLTVERASMNDGIY